MQLSVLKRNLFDATPCRQLCGLFIAVSLLKVYCGSRNMHQIISDKMDVIAVPNNQIISDKMVVITVPF